MARHLPERTVSICSTHRCHTIEAASIGIRTSRCCGMTRTHRLSYRLHDVYLGNLLIPYRGAPTAGNRGAAMLSSRLAAGHGIRPRCGASCPFGSLDRGGCGLVVGDDPPWCLRSVSIPV